MSYSCFAGLLLLAVPFIAGCNIGDPTCDDCEPCGIAGPVASPGQTIDVVEAGLNASGVAAVNLQLEDGMCIGMDRKGFLVSYEAGAVKVSPFDGQTPLSTKATSMDGEKFTWTDRNLTMSSTRSGETLVLTFVDAGKSTKVACAGADHAITCKGM